MMMKHYQCNCLETMTPTKHICPRWWGFKSSLAHHWSEIFLVIRHKFHTSILQSNWIIAHQQTSIWNLRIDVYFEYNSCYFKLVTLFIKNLFWVILPYLLFDRSLYLCFCVCSVVPVQEVYSMFRHDVTSVFINKITKHKVAFVKKINLWFFDLKYEDT
jgi:hypothetical protein